MSQRFANKVIWITGASSGIGASLARAFSAEGAQLILSARRAQRLQALQAQLSHPEQTLVLPLDVTHPESIDRATQEALGWRGHIDMLVNNAGISQRSCVADTSMDTFRHVMEVNYFGIVHLTGGVLPDMIARGEGHVVNVSSVAGYVSTPMRSAYASSKHAAVGEFITSSPDSKGSAQTSNGNSNGFAAVRHSRKRKRHLENKCGATGISNHRYDVSKHIVSKHIVSYRVSLTFGFVQSFELMFFFEFVFFFEFPCLLPVLLGFARICVFL